MFIVGRFILGLLAGAKRQHVDRRCLAHVDPVQTVVRLIKQRVLADVATRVAQDAQYPRRFGVLVPSQRLRAVTPCGGFKVVIVDPTTGRHCRCGAPDEFAILADAQAAGQGAHCELVPDADIVAQRDLAHCGFVPRPHGGAASKVLQRRGHVIHGAQKACLLALRNVVCLGLVHGFAKDLHNGGPALPETEPWIVLINVATITATLNRL